jgi:YHS domain-containing protein
MGCHDHDASRYFCLKISSPGKTKFNKQYQQPSTKEQTMNETKSVTKDPICGMTVDQATAIRAERDGKTFYFCGEHCRQIFLAKPAGAKQEEKSGGCCG